jgi:prophage regulatory protein
MNTYLRVKSVAQKLDMSESSVWRLAQQGVLPKPIKIAPRTSVWRESDVEAVIEKIIDKRGCSYESF